MPFFKVITLLNNQQGLTNCCYVHPNDVLTLMKSVFYRSDPTRIPENGILCRILNQARTTAGYYYVRACKDIPQGHIAIGLLQRINYDIRIDSNCEVNTILPPHVMNMTSVHIEITSLGMSKSVSYVDTKAFSAHIQNTYNEHMFKRGDSFCTLFQNMMYKVCVIDFSRNSKISKIKSSAGRLSNTTVIYVSSTVLNTKTIISKPVDPKPTEKKPVAPFIKIEEIPRRSSRLSNTPRVNYKE
jgi:hypothetical protein